MLASFARSRLPRLLQCSRQLSGLSSTIAGQSSHREQVEQLRHALAEAVEGAQTVGASAQQLLLETDPAARGPREQYQQHYGEMALVQLNAALDLVGHLRSQLGTEAADTLMRQERLALPLADAQLWRDRTAAELAAIKRRAEANEISCDT